MARKFAVFDIDGTIIRWQLYHAVVTELAKQGSLPADAEHKIAEARMAWKKRAHSESFREYEQVLVKIYLEALSSLNIQANAKAVSTVFEEYKDQTYTYTRDLISQLKAQNYLLFAVSGSQQDIVDKLANYYGFDDALGAVLVQKDGRYTGELTTPIFDKQKGLAELVAKHDTTYEGSIAVGDSESDQPMLAAVEQPIAFNPSAGLLKIALSQGWKIVIERKNVAYELEEHNGQYLLAAPNN